VKLGNNGSGACAVLSEAYGGEAMKKSRVSEWYKQLKERTHVKYTTEDNAHHFLQYQGHYSLLIHSTRPHSQLNLLCENILWLYEAACRKRTEFWSNTWILHHDKAPAHKALSVKQSLA
jgi:hypothetical protein